MAPGFAALFQPLRRLAGKLGYFLAQALIAALLLAGCGAPQPPRPQVAPAPPPAPPSRTSQEAALDQALGSFHGAPYRSGGTTPAGVDCSGLIQSAFHQAGINLPRTVAQQFETGQPVALHNLRFGDVVYFNRYCQTARGRKYFMAGMLNPAYAEQVCHNGVYLGDGRFIHASPKGVYISRLDAEVWRVSFMGARRYLPGGP